MEEKKIKVLITGGAGFIGSHVAKHCIDLGMSVVVLDDLTGGNLRNVDDLPGSFVFGSVLDHNLVDQLFHENQFDYVYHLAAYAAENLSHFIRRHNYHVNLIGSINIINACVNHNVKCLVFTSSIAVHANGTPPYQESDPFMAGDPYGIAKAAVEIDLARALEMFGLNHIIFRPYNVYGPHQNLGDKYRNVIGIFMNQVMQGKPMTIFGDGSQVRSFSYIDDVAPHISKSVLREELYNNTFFIGGANGYQVNELAYIVGKEFGLDKPEDHMVHLAARHEAKVAYALTDKSRMAFGGPTIPLAEGIKRMAAWARSVGHVTPVEFESIEIRKNLPEGW